MISHISDAMLSNMLDVQGSTFEKQLLKQVDHLSNYLQLQLGSSIKYFGNEKGEMVKNCLKFAGK